MYDREHAVLGSTPRSLLCVCACVCVWVCVCVFVCVCVGVSWWVYGGVCVLVCVCVGGGVCVCVSSFITLEAIVIISMFAKRFII